MNLLVEIKLLFYLFILRIIFQLIKVKSGRLVELLLFALFKGLLFVFLVTQSFYLFKLDCIIGEDEAIFVLVSSCLLVLYLDVVLNLFNDFACLWFEVFYLVGLDCDRFLVSAQVVVG
jgi:hypothetical protein